MPRILHNRHLLLLVGALTVSLTVPAAAAVLYVDGNGTNPAPPYADWSTAATNIQDAVDASTNGDLILVTNGVYRTGGRQTPDMLTNRVVVDKVVTVQSVNGPAVTTIEGFHEFSTNNESGWGRCVYLTSGATLRGFTLTEGWAVAGTTAGRQGGAVWSSNPLYAFVFDCVLSNNFAEFGGGAYGCSLSDCVLISNTVPMYGGTVPSGGGAYFCLLKNCLLVGNSAWYGGGADYSPSVINCTIVGNQAEIGGGTYNSGLQSCIVYDNTAFNESNYDSADTLDYCCTWPSPTNGAGNITNEPLFVNASGGNFHLQPNSRCINAGEGYYDPASTDLDGNPRVRGGTVDIGAYEFQGQATGTFAGWLAQYSLPTDGSADYADTDGDGMNNWQEWMAGTDPTNALSLLEMLSLAWTNSPSGIVVTWQSATNRTYFLQRSGGLSPPPPFSAIQSNIVGQAGTTTYTDTSATNGGPYFYRADLQ